MNNIPNTLTFKALNTSNEGEPYILVDITLTMGSTFLILREVYILLSFSGFEKCFLKEKQYLLKKKI